GGELTQLGDGGGGELDAVRRGPQSGGLEITRRHHLRGGVGGADLLLELLDLAADLIGVSEGGDVEGEQQMPGVHLGGGVLPDVHGAEGEGGAAQSGRQAFDEDGDAGALVAAEGQQGAAVEDGAGIDGPLPGRIDGPVRGDGLALLMGGGSLRGRGGAPGPRRGGRGGSRGPPPRSKRGPSPGGGSGPPGGRRRPCGGRGGWWGGPRWGGTAPPKAGRCSGGWCKGWGG